jgi:hypothetical protein
MSGEGGAGGPIEDGEPFVHDSLLNTVETITVIPQEDIILISTEDINVDTESSSFESYSSSSEEEDPEDPPWPSKKKPRRLFKKQVKKIPKPKVPKPR